MMKIDVEDIRVAIQHAKDKEWKLARWAAYTIINVILRRLYVGVDRKTRRKELMAYNKSKFVDIPLEALDKKKIVELSDDSEWITDKLEEAVSQGYRVSMAPDPKNDCYSATISCISNDANKDTIMTSRGRDPIRVLVATLYRACVLRNWGAWAGEGEGDELGFS